MEARREVVKGGAIVDSSGERDRNLAVMEQM
jgi:hypothetical protein